MGNRDRNSDSDRIFVFLLIFVVLGMLAVFWMGAAYGKESTLQSICDRSGYDGWQRVMGADYCYTVTNDNIVVVPLLVADSVTEE